MHFCPKLFVLFLDNSGMKTCMTKITGLESVYCEAVAHLKPLLGGLVRMAGQCDAREDRQVIGS